MKKSIKIIISYTQINYYKNIHYITKIYYYKQKLLFRLDMIPNECLSLFGFNLVFK